MASLACEIPSSLLGSLEARAAATGESLTKLVLAALSQYLDHPIHTLFQVSTSGALVAGQYTGAVSSDLLLKNGDFGLGTFDHLDGEMVVLDGRVWRVRGDGTVTEATGDATAPFAMVTTFDPKLDVMIQASDSLDMLMRLCDEHRSSANIFYAIRLDGTFTHVRTRAVSTPAENTRLIDAAKAQTEFDFNDIEGTLVGLWSPSFSGAFSIPGYHFHFLSKDHQHGGHLLAASAGTLRLRLEELSDFHLALPENEGFLNADLSKDTTEELSKAEHSH